MENGRAHAPAKPGPAKHAMKLDIEIGGITHVVEVARAEQRLPCTIDGIALEADCVESSAGVYSILLAGRSIEVNVKPFGERLRIEIGGRELTASVRDPRKWRRNHSAAASSDHRQSVPAPMPGRVVRVLVALGETIKAGQGIVVVEAMKMQNEVRSPKSGSVERLMVKEGQSVNAGDTIALIA